MSLLRYTGLPFVDVGVAAITIISQRHRPEDVTLDDLERVAQQLKEDYCNLKPLRNVLSTIFLNSPFVQAAMKQEDRLSYADRVLFAFRPDRALLPDTSCIFFPEKSAVLLAHRQHIPLLNGGDLGNFSAMGRAGVPVSGVALLAIHAMPLACLRAGNYLAFHQLRSSHSTGRDMTLLLANQAYRVNAAAIQQMRLGDGHVDFPNRGSYKRTRYVAALLSARTLAKRASPKELHNITGYYFSNYGPDARLELLRLENNVINFIDTAMQDAATTWQRLATFSWEAPKREESTERNETTTATWRNRMYEDLFGLPDGARRFLSRHLGNRYRPSVIDWQLISIFLEKILFMEAERINTYKQLGDRLDAYMQKYEGKAMGFYHSFARAKDYSTLRRVLRTASEKMLKAGEKEALFTYDEFVAAFERPTSGRFNDWRLGRDLIGIRMLELMHKRGEDLSELEPDDEEDVQA